MLYRPKLFVKSTYILTFLVTKKNTCVPKFYSKLTQACIVAYQDRLAHTDTDTVYWYLFVCHRHFNFLLINLYKLSLNMIFAIIFIQSSFSVELPRTRRIPIIVLFLFFVSCKDYRISRKQTCREIKVFPLCLVFSVNYLRLPPLHDAVSEKLL